MCVSSCLLFSSRFNLIFLVSTDVNTMCILARHLSTIGFLSNFSAIKITWFLTLYYFVRTVYRYWTFNQSVGQVCRHANQTHIELALALAADRNWNQMRSMLSKRKRKHSVDEIQKRENQNSFAERISAMKKLILHQSFHSIHVIVFICDVYRVQVIYLRFILCGFDFYFSAPLSSILLELKEDFVECIRSHTMLQKFERNWSTTTTSPIILHISFYFNSNQWCSTCYCSMRRRTYYKVIQFIFYGVYCAENRN